MHFREMQGFLEISIHAPRKGSDHTGRASGAGPQGFQSTLPVRGATNTREPVHNGLEISIHAPRKGSDRQRTNQ